MSDGEQIVRVQGADLRGNKKIAVALTKIKGVGYNLAKNIVQVSDINENKKVSELSENEIKKLEDIISDPGNYGIPSYMLNRQKDYESGENLHITGSELQVLLRDNLNRLKKIRSYRGIRHEKGLTVRGQKTKSSFRHGGPALKKKQSKK
ncbi:MAG: 30S ribosomal protein S13 [Candidatus Omnitrophica bacterium]|nr:30S ribosomal protein S13 [Candidatus Omnitrophota bacterium]